VPALAIEPERERTLAGNPRRAAYYGGAAASLQADLRALGASLVVLRSATPKAVLRLARDAGVRAVCWAAAYDAAAIERDRSLQATLEEAGLRVSIVHDAPAVAPDETAALRRDEGAGYRALAPYVAAWRGLPRAPFAGPVRFARIALATGPLPQAAQTLDEAPSEARALAAFDEYLESAVLAYRTARNVPGGGPTARLSAALSFGVVSARTLLARLDARARDPFLLAEERTSLEALVRALAQRDFFLQLGWFYAERPDAELQTRMRGFAFARRHAALPAWREGRTGYPLVDAGVRQLLATGWMHPRVRLVAASFLCFDLGVDWRVGRDAWEDLLVEEEPALATGNWQWAAGVGADLAQYPRIYNPRRQARSFDPQGTYVRRWIPELASVPGAGVLEPQAAGRRRQLALPLFDGAAYPAPVVEHEAAARAFLAKYAAFAGRP
jgi:deoxyribodipyrimidine photo-lyase